MKIETSANHPRPKVMLITASLLVGAAGVGGLYPWPFLVPSVTATFGWSLTNSAAMWLAMGLVAAISGTLLSITIRPGAIPLVSLAASGVMLGGGALVVLSQTPISMTVGIALIGGATGAFLACAGLLFSGQANGNLIFAATSGLGMSLLLVAIFVPILMDIVGWLLLMATSVVTSALVGIAAGLIGLTNRELLKGLSSKNTVAEPQELSDQLSIAGTLVVSFLAIIWGMVVLGQLATIPLAFQWEYGYSSLRVGLLFALVGLGIVGGGGIGLTMRDFAPRLILLPVFAMLGALSIVSATAKTGSVDYFVVMGLLSVNAGVALSVLMAAGREYSIKGHRANTFTLSLCVAMIGVIFLVFANIGDSSGDFDLSGPVRKIGTWGLVLFVVLGSVYTVLPFLPKLNRMVK